MPMQKDEFIDYMSNPAGLDEKSLTNLKEILRDYPYFQAAHLLLVKNLSNLNHMKFDNQLRLSAAYVGNRQLLFRLISEASSISESKSTDYQDIEQPVTEVTFVSTEVKDEADQEGKSIADIVLEQVKEMKESHGQQVSTELIETDSSDTREIFEIDDKQQITEAGPVREDTGTKSKSLVDLLVIDEPSDEEDAIPDEPEERKKPVGKGKKPKSTQKKTLLEKEIHLHESHSFTSWLSLFREDDYNSPNKSQYPQSKNQKDKKDLIEDFITKQPRMEKPDMLSGNEKVEDISQHSLLESEDFITETLANIYVKQKKYDKAISFYEKLSLKYPEKVSYFAIQIEEIKKLLTNNNS